MYKQISTSLTKYLGFLGSRFSISKDLKIKIFFQKSQELIVLHLYLYGAHSRLIVTQT